MRDFVSLTFPGDDMAHVTFAKTEVAEIAQGNDRAYNSKNDDKFFVSTVNIPYCDHTVEAIRTFVCRRGTIMRIQFGENIGEEMCCQTLLALADVKIGRMYVVNIASQSLLDMVCNLVASPRMRICALGLNITAALDLSRIRDLISNLTHNIKYMMVATKFVAPESLVRHAMQRTKLTSFGARRRPVFMVAPLVYRREEMKIYHAAKVRGIIEPFLRSKSSLKLPRELIRMLASFLI